MPSNSVLPIAEVAESKVVRPLFRHQALAHIGTHRYGEIVLARPVSFSFLTLFFCFVAASIVAFFVGFSHTRKAHVPGVLVPSLGVIRVTSAQAGIISERRVAENQTVKSGDILFVVNSERSSSTQGKTDQAISALLQAKRDSLTREQEQMQLQAKQRLDAVKRRAIDLADDLKRLGGQIVLQQYRVDLAKDAVKRYSDLLHNTHYVALAQVQEKQAEFLDQQQRLMELHRSKAATARDLSDAEANLHDLELQAQRDQQSTERSIADVEKDLTETEARREILITAPQDGFITALSAEPGQTVTTNQVLASVLPAGCELEAELHASSSAIGFIKPGMDVLIRYASYPYQKFGQAHGVVRDVSNTTMRPEELNLPNGNTSEALYRIRVKLDRQTVKAYKVEEALKSGATLDASVLLEKRRLYEWILEPLYTITGRL